MKTVDERIEEIMNKVVLKAIRKDEAITKIRKIIESESLTRSLAIIEYLLKKIIKNEKTD